MTKLNEQMEMFQEGGLEQDGGTQDPVSGNEVPTGSSQAEVRDDIPAMLSEGEFVFPADVVRYIGLETLMNIRQQAKAGLKRMEDMGQMGNSSEATIPDDVPFTVDDLEVEDAPKEMFVGGVIPSGGFGIPPATTMPVSQQQQQVTPMPPYGLSPPNKNKLNLNPNQLGGLFGFQPQQAQTPIVPTTAPTYNVQGQQTNKLYNVPTFTPQQAVGTFETLTGDKPGGFGQTDVIKTYVNEDGMELRIPFKGGNPIYDIPPGYVEKVETEKVKDSKPTDTKVKTTKVVDTGGMEEGEQLDPSEVKAKNKRMRDRIAKAKEMGYTVMANPFKELAKGLSPFGNIGTLPSGTIIGSGYVTDGKGNLFDPLTNKTQSGSVLGQLKDLFLKPSDGEEKEPDPPRKTEVTDPSISPISRPTERLAQAEREKATARAKDKLKRATQRLTQAEREKATAKAEDKLKRATQKREDEKDISQQKAAEKAFSKTFAEQMAKINQEAGPEDQASDQQADARESMTDRGGFEGEIGDYKGAFVGRKYKKNKGMKRGGLASKK